MNLRREFSKIYNQYIDKIYRFVFLKVNSQEIAEDLTSETFLRCWKKFKENHQEIENHQAFLYQIARNLITDHYREKGRTQIVSTDCVPIVDPRANIAETAQTKFDLETVKATLAKLDGDYQEMLIWYYIDDLSIPEIAKMTNKTEGNVRVLIHRALKTLRETINSI